MKKVEESDESFYFKDRKPYKRIDYGADASITNTDTLFLKFDGEVNASGDSKKNSLLKDVMQTNLAIISSKQNSKLAKAGRNSFDRASNEEFVIGVDQAANKRIEKERRIQYKQMLERDNGGAPMGSGRRSPRRGRDPFEIVEVNYSGLTGLNIGEGSLTSDLKPSLANIQEKAKSQQLYRESLAEQQETARRMKKQQMQMQENANENAHPPPYLSRY